MATTDRRQTQAGAPGWRKWAWFAGLWVAGVIGVTVFAYGLRFIMELVGLTG